MYRDGLWIAVSVVEMCVYDAVLFNWINKKCLVCLLKWNYTGAVSDVERWEIPEVQTSESNWNWRKVVLR